MKFIGQFIQDFIARFRNDVFLEDVDSGTIASGGNLGLDSNNKIVKAAVPTDTNTQNTYAISCVDGDNSDEEKIRLTQGGADGGATDDIVLEAGTGLSIARSSDKITFTNTVSDTNTNRLTEFTLEANSGSSQTIAHGDTLTIEGGNAISTEISGTDTVIVNHDDTSSQASVSNSGATFIQDITLDTYGHVTGITSADAVEGDITAVVAGTNLSGGGVEGDVTINLADASTSAKGAASFSSDNFAVSSGAVTIKSGGVDLTDEVTGVLPVANTAAKVTSIVAGEGIDVSGATGDVTISGEDASISNKGIASFATSDFSVVSGAVALRQKAYFLFQGYGTSDGTNYEMAEILSDTNAPFEHNTSRGSDGLTAGEPRAFMKAGARVMPYSGTLKRWQGWATSAGSGTIDIGLFKVTPTRNNTTNLTPVLLKNHQFTALGNTKLEDIEETSFSVTFAAGDMVYTALKGSTTNKAFFFTTTLEVEWD